MDTIDALGIIRGRMNDDLKLLNEALHAARKGKLHVVIDHLERVTAAQQHVLHVTKFHTESENGSAGN